VLDYSTTKPFQCQALFYIFFTSFFERKYTPHERLLRSWNPLPPVPLPMPHVLLPDYRRSS